MRIYLSSPLVIAHSQSDVSDTFNLMGQKNAIFHDTHTSYSKWYVAAGQLSISFRYSYASYAEEKCFLRILPFDGIW